MSTWVRRIRILDRDQAIVAIAHIRTEWEDAYYDQDLVHVSGSVGLLLADLGIALGFSPEEMQQALGSQLANQLSDLQQQLLK
jgi:hypothetical protein